VVGIVEHLRGASASTPLVVGGVVLLEAGIALRLWSIATLGRDFATALGSARLVTTEPYRFVRHPSELGLLLAAFGGVEGQNPVAQLYGEILAAGCLNHEENGRPTQRIFGSYTVGDNWTFVRADLDALDTAHPSMLVVSSWEINEKQEAATIVKILKAIVAQHGTPRSMPA